MAEEVPDEVDRLARVEEMDGRRMTKHVHVPARDGQSRLGCIAAEESLNPAGLEPALSADEESAVRVYSACEILDEKRDEIPEDRTLSGQPSFEPVDADALSFEIDVLASRSTTWPTRRP